MWNVAVDGMPLKWYKWNWYNAYGLSEKTKNLTVHVSFFFCRVYINHSWRLNLNGIHRHKGMREEKPVFSFWCWAPSMGGTGTILMSLVWYGRSLNSRPPALEAFYAYLYFSDLSSPSVSPILILPLPVNPPDHSRPGEDTAHCNLLTLPSWFYRNSEMSHVIRKLKSVTRWGIKRPVLKEASLISKFGV